jgi:hypothetical protein
LCKKLYIHFKIGKPVCLRIQHDVLHRERFTFPWTASDPVERGRKSLSEYSKRGRILILF